MKTVKVYKYEDGEVVKISTTLPEVSEYTTLTRLIAGKDKALKHESEELFFCIDVESVEGWTEVDYKEEVYMRKDNESYKKTHRM